MDKTYNMNVMRPALIELRNNGNRGVLTKAFCEERRISNTYFQIYIKGLEDLFNATCDYCRMKNSPTADPAEVDAALAKIFPLWRQFLNNGEKDTHERDFRVSEHDVSNLVSFCQTFMKDANDVSLGKDDTFTAHMSWAMNNFKTFQKKVEIDLGIRIAGIEVMSDTRRDFLRAESKILSRIKKAERRVTDATVQKDKLNGFLAKAKGDEMKDMLTAQIKELDEVIATQNAKIESYKKQHEELLNPPAEAEEVSAETAEAPAEAAAAEPEKVSKPNKVRTAAKGKGGKAKAGKAA